jgi:hypothetical protein
VERVLAWLLRRLIREGFPQGDIDPDEGLEGLAELREVFQEGGELPPPPAGWPDSPYKRACATSCPPAPRWMDQFEATYWGYDD